MELGGLSGAGRVISKLVTFADAVLTVLCFSYRIPLHEIIPNTYFAASSRIEELCPRFSISPKNQR